MIETGIDITGNLKKEVIAKVDILNLFDIVWGVIGYRVS